MAVGQMLSFEESGNIEVVAGLTMHHFRLPERSSELGLTLVLILVVLLVRQKMSQKQQLKVTVIDYRLLKS